jgi:hypothetical protein
MFISCVYMLFSVGRGLCGGMITRPKSYTVCEEETTGIKPRPSSSRLLVTFRMKLYSNIL